MKRSRIIWLLLLAATVVFCWLSSPQQLATIHPTGGTVVAVFAGVVLLAAAAICGRVAWRGRLKENQPAGRWVFRWVKMVLAVFLLILITIFLLFCWAYKDFGQHDMGH